MHGREQRRKHNLVQKNHVRQSAESITHRNLSSIAASARTTTSGLCSTCARGRLAQQAPGKFDSGSLRKMSKAQDKGKNATLGIDRKFGSRGI